MNRLWKVLHRWIFEKYDQFANELGYADWKITLENTFGIFQMEGDAFYHATQLPNSEWAVWNDSWGDPPYAFQVFSTWAEAISHLQKLFKESQLPESYWRPEGFDVEEDVFSKEPNREKML
ncbi:hypothetical protein AUC31_01935 [Planococcus rifietoensis]|uniref:Uncharacterized protein n=1 Tax=Planococcus rifietoensis TaxID=200991 RepID=A0A0U2XNJ3_9BACL|nr:hypothetical protein [Planococcus rifietoensis]ALS74088.1 hypothetical protein AUC31_01935 [Planococcus rifietoensis]